MGWIIGLLSNHQDDFWLNVFAGLPFLFFDLIIITLLLPVTIQWWDDLRWRPMRSEAINQLIESYSQTVELRVDTLDLLRFYQGNVSMSQSDIALSFRQNRERWSELVSRLDAEVQTALPVLGPDASKDLLDFHYAWRKWIRIMNKHLLDYGTGVRLTRYKEFDDYERSERSVDYHGRRLYVSYVSDIAVATDMARKQAFIFEDYLGEIRFYLGLAKIRSETGDRVYSEQFDVEHDNDLRRGQISIRDIKLYPVVKRYHSGSTLFRRANKKRLPLFIEDAG